MKQSLLDSIIEKVKDSKQNMSECYISYEI
jgi:hypothetical protein